MPDRTSALYVTKAHVDIGAGGWRSSVLARIEQIARLDLHATMARLDDRLLYLMEGEAEAVAGFLALLSDGKGDPNACSMIEPGVVRWDARPGRLITPLLTQDEKCWLLARLPSLAQNAREIQACLQWANMRTRETAFFDFGWIQPSGEDSFPSAVR